MSPARRALQRRPRPVSANHAAILMIEQGGSGGIADYTAQLAGALARRGRRVELATATDHLYPPIEGVAIHPVFPFLRGTSGARRALRRLRLHKIFNALGYVFALMRLAPLARRCEIVHLQGGRFPPLDAAAMVCLRTLGTPLVHTPHNVFDRRHSFPRSRRLLGRSAARTIVHARADLEQLTEKIARCAVVIPHGEYGALARSGGGAERSSARAELGLDPGAFVTLLFGQLRHDKGIRDILEAARGLPGVHVLIAGEDIGALASVAELLSAPELVGRVLVREGFHPMSEAAKFFAAADTVAVPYRRASQSGVLLLAYGFERPVIVYPVGGLVEVVVDGETGWICRQAEPGALAEALAAAQAAGAEECRRRGAAGARLADERFSWREIARLTDELYEQVASGRSPALGDDAIRGS